MRHQIINYCQERYNFFGTGIMNKIYWHTVIILRRTYL